MREHKWHLNEVFVFGSNLLGIHGAGAAKFARDNCNAILGVGQGYMNENPEIHDGCYALPTCSAPGVPLTLDQVKVYVEAFLIFARLNPDMSFFVTRVGCGIAGFTDNQIGPLFDKAPLNCLLPPEWDNFAAQLITAIEAER